MAHFGYTIVHVPDVAAAIDFYERAFGLSRRFLHESNQYGEMETGATALAFAAEELIATNFTLAVRHNRPDNEPGAIELVFVDPEVEGLYRNALAAGAVAVAEPTRKPWGQTVAYVRDLNGVLVELCSPMG